MLAIFKHGLKLSENGKTTAMNLKKVGNQKCYKIESSLKILVPVLKCDFGVQDLSNLKLNNVMWSMVLISFKRFTKCWMQADFKLVHMYYKIFLLLNSIFFGGNDFLNIFLKKKNWLISLP